MDHDGHRGSSHFRKMGFEATKADTNPDPGALCPGSASAADRLVVARERRKYGPGEYGPVVVTVQDFTFACHSSAVAR